MDLTVIFGAACLGLTGVIVYLLTKKQATDPTLLEWVKTTQSQMQELQRTLLENSRVSSQQIGQNITTQTREITDRLTKATEVITQLREMGQSMKDLDALLKSPKLRGNMGERVLADLIGQVFPKQSFYLQHHFKNGAIVDAAIQTDAGILSIDSKFPMEHFQAMIKRETQEERELARKEFARDVRKHIDAIAAKYILPEEGTMDFALMYVPSETVYYEIASDDQLLEHARHARVYPVSPTTMYAHLQTILLSFEGKKIETKTKEAFKLLRGVQKDYDKLIDHFATLGKHLTNATNMYGVSQQSMGAIERGLLQLKQLSQGAQSEPT